MGKKVILFGASSLGEEAYIKIREEFNIEYFCDNDEKKWGKHFCNVEIISPEELEKMGEYYIIIASMYTFEISEQLINMNIKKFGIYRSKKYLSENINTYFIEEFDMSHGKKKDINNKICLITTSNSGSNILALYKLIPEKMKEKFDITLCHSDDKKSDFFLGYDFMKEVLENKMLIFDVRSPAYKYEHNIFFQLWHGFPIKGIGYMSNSQNSNEYQHEHWRKFDYIASYSQFYNMAMGACIGIERDKFTITGMPRNDFLYKVNGKENLEMIYNKDFSKQKIIYFMPTYRKSSWLKEESGEKQWGNIFGMENFDNVKFNQYLKDNNLIVIFKTHPLEENEVVAYLEENEFDNILILTNKMLIKHKLDLYETLNAADMLITDYSSVFFDFLLLDRPILFAPVDLDKYSETRGLILEPYDLWTPGPKVLSQVELQNEISRCIGNEEYYKEERERMKKITHVHTDGNSSERIWDIILQGMSN